MRHRQCLQSLIADITPVGLARMFWALSSDGDGQMDRVNGRVFASTVLLQRRRDRKGLMSIGFVKLIVQVPKEWMSSQR